MLPSCIKTEVWRELAESLSAKLKVPVVCEQAVFGKLSFFQELRNRSSDVPYSAVPGIRYVSVDVDGSQVFVGPFRTDELHALDEELSDARKKLPVWKNEYADLIETVVRQAAVAGRSERVLREALNRSKLLLEFSQAIAHVNDVDKALYTAIQFLAHKFKLSNVFFSAYGKQARYFDLSEAGKAVEQRVVAQVKGTKSTCTIQNVASDFLLEGIKNRESLSKCVSGFPLVLNRELVGCSVLYSEHILPLDGISEVLYELVAVLSRLSQYEKVQVSAVTDPLTGLSNRGELVLKFEKMLSELSREKGPISALMIDVDNFKKFNDTKGHPEGDRILRSVADVIKTVSPKDAICSRYGGEEFMVVLPGLQQQGAKDIAENLRTTVEQVCELTVSIGMIHCLNSSVSRETLVREADRALYRAKHLGKNKVITFVIVDKSLGIIDA